MYNDYTYLLMVADRIRELHEVADRTRLARSLRRDQSSWADRMRHSGAGIGRALRPNRQRWSLRVG